jgi:hypothetical protein
MTHFTMLHKSPTHAGVKIYNHLPADIKDLADYIKSFKSTKELFASAFYLCNG